MRTQRAIFTLILIGSLLNFKAVAQKDYSAKLHKEIVNIEDDKYKVQDFLFLNFNDGTSMQIKIAATCPTEVMNRDNFISMYTMYAVTLLFATLREMDKDVPAIKSMDELIGEPDLTYNFIMAKNGMQIQVISAQGKENVTTTWEKFFAE